MPPNLTSAFPACGFCHDPSPNANGRMNLAIQPAAFSVARGAMISVNVTVSGGPNRGQGGFCIESSGGVFQPGVTTRGTPAGDAITHNSNSNTQWAFQWQAPNATGLVRWTAAGQSVSGDFTPTGDSFGFWGPDSAVPGVPLRIFVNSTNVTSFGSGCAGTGNPAPLLGAAADATLGQNFNVELHSAPVNALSFCVLGDSNTQMGAIPLPLDLGIIGAPGCFLRASMVFTFTQTTAGTGSGGGAATFPWPIPNDPSLRGASLYFQGLVVDPVNQLGLTTSNALRAVLQ